MENPGNAAQVAHLLGFASDKPGQEDLWESEVGRRRFWACYLMGCHASEGLSVIEGGETTLRLTLPWREEDFEAGTPSKPRSSIASGQSNGGLFCELIKAMTLW